MGAVMNLIGVILSWIIYFYLVVMMLRVVFSWIELYNPRWRPRSVMLVIANFVYALTDPPLRFLGRYIPPLRLGNIALDVGFLVLFLAVTLLQRLVAFIFFNFS